MNEVIHITGRRPPPGVRPLSDDQVWLVRFKYQQEAEEIRQRHPPIMQQIADDANDLLECIHQHYDYRTGLCALTIHELAQKMGITQKRVWAAYGILRDEGHLRKVAFPAHYVGELLTLVPLDPASERIARQFIGEAESQTT
jgi:DNA-binding transcriptional regulator YhcF (GntR family)